IPGNLEYILQSWDMTFKDSDGSDYVCGQVWGNAGANIYMLPDREYGRFDFPVTLEAFERLTSRNPEATTKLVEDKANGPAVIAMLKNKIGGIIPINPKGSKIARASAISPLIEAGNVYLPSPSICPWINDFIEECASFPNGAHDDQVDAMTQALQRLMHSGGCADSFLAGDDPHRYRRGRQVQNFDAWPDDDPDDDDTRDPGFYGR
ncbi:MAG TPA: phage terminase large subunit, partial [Bacillota bacterium]|nr:phage terminase large subunit [Bacillota bacterium]